MVYRGSMIIVITIFTIDDHHEIHNNDQMIYRVGGKEDATTLLML